MAKTGSKLTSISDNKLVEMALCGNQSAFSALHAKYEKAVSSQISKIVKNAVEIEDICIESFERAFQKLDTFNPEMRFSTWLFAIARNNALDHQAKDQGKSKIIDKTPIELNQDTTSNVPDSQPSPEEKVISSQDHDTFLSCIQGLPDLYRDIASMCFVDNLGYKEISEKAGLPINTVKTRISRARALIIRKMLEEE